MQNPIKILTQMFADATIPAGGKIFRSSSVEFLIKLKYDYATIEKLLEDERVYSIVVMVASMVQKAYVGPEIRPAKRFQDVEFDDKEAKAMEAAIVVSEDLKFRQLCFDYAFQLVTHGDLYERITKDGTKGITKLTSIPLNSARSLANEGQAKMRAGGAQILEENFVSIMKTINDTNPEVLSLEKNEYFHLSFKNHAVWRKDIQDSDSYGIYSKPPIATLQRLVEWKKKTIENDVIWKNKLLPKWVFKLKMPSIVPSKYTGTQSEKVSAAMADAELLTNQFINKTTTTRPDDDLVLSDAVDASVLEAKSTNYMKPNETISQINTILNSPQGMPSGILGDASGASVGLEIAAVFAGIRIDYIVRKIADKLTEVMKSHVRLVESAAGEDVIKRLFIHVDPSLTVEKFERVKTALSMAATGQFLSSEIREAAGYVRLPQLPADKFVKIAAGEFNKSVNDQVKNIAQEKTGSGKNNQTPGGERNTMQES